jgi:hypothetical protein
MLLLTDIGSIGSTLMVQKAERIGRRNDSICITSKGDESRPYPASLSTSSRLTHSI